MGKARHKQPTNLKHPGFSMVKVRQFPPIWMASTARMMIVTAVLITSKIHLIPYQLAGAFNPAVTIPNQESPWVKLGKNSQKPGAAESAIVTAQLPELKTPHHLKLSQEFLSASKLHTHHKKFLHTPTCIPLPANIFDHSSPHLHTNTNNFLISTDLTHEQQLQ
jgi:hypothetical protein